QPAATLPVSLVMMEAIRDFVRETGRPVGFKPAGGIRTSKQAIAYLVVLYETLGPEWMTPERFRLGASSLLNDVLMQIEKERSGASRRARYLFRISRILHERARELAVVETMDGGKPIKESRDVDIPLSAAHFFYYAGWADKLEWAFPNVKPRPIGVAGQVIPWNFPLLMLAWKIAPALAAGN